MQIGFGFGLWVPEYYLGTLFVFTHFVIFIALRSKPKSFSTLVQW